jgi:hypothetical protein
MSMFFIGIQRLDTVFNEKHKFNLAIIVSKIGNICK